MRLSLVCLMLGLSSCSGSGFHLKGADPMVMQGRTLAIEGGATNAEFVALVKLALQGRGAVLTDAANAELVVKMVSVTESRRVSGYSSTRAVSGFRYMTEANFTLQPKGAVAPISDSVAQSQSQTYDSDYVLGTQEEAEQIKASLRREVARLLALKVAAFKT